MKIAEADEYAAEGGRRADGPSRTPPCPGNVGAFAGDASACDGAARRAASLIRSIDCSRWRRAFPHDDEQAVDRVDRRGQRLADRI